MDKPPGNQSATITTAQRHKHGGPFKVMTLRGVKTDGAGSRPG
jgi:hypothetical protein